MPILVVELEGSRRAAVLPPRILIGRKSMNHLVIDHRAVSRLHAWIDGRAGDGWYIADATSRTGTRVNGEPVIRRRLLNDGDEITVGPATIRFLADARLPEGAEAFEIPAEPTIAPKEKGVRFDCTCGAPLWAGEGFYGHVGQCTYCGQALAVPYPSATRPGARTRKPPVVHAAEAAQRRQDELQIRSDESTADPTPAPAPDAAPAPAAKPRLNARGQEVCGACQSAIGQFEDRTVCPACGLTYHADCWTENYGCGAYGCSQVNALKPPDETPTAAPEVPGERATVDEADPAAGQYAGEPAAAPPFPWEFLLLAGSVFAALLGAVTFGVPSLAAAGGSVAYLARHRGRQQPAPPRTGVLVASVALAVAGMVAGVAVSYVLYFGGRGRM